MSRHQKPSDIDAIASSLKTTSLASLADLYYVSSRPARFLFSLIGYALGPVTLIAATWKAMALPSLGIPVGIITIVVVIWTFWLFTGVVLTNYKYGYLYGRIGAVSLSIIAICAFLLYSPMLTRPLNLVHADLGAIRLTGLSLSYANLRFANLRGAVLSGLNLDHSDLRDAHLEDSKIDNVIITDSHIARATFINAQILQSIFLRVDGASSDFSNARVDDTVFVGSNLDGSTFTSSRFTCTNFIDDSEHLNFQIGLRA
jgi:Pentapeptide repeats (8 copies)